MSTELISEATENDFEQRVLERSHETPILVDFWAAWCGPCRMLAPTLEAAVTARAGKVLLVKVDADQAPELARSYDVRGIPAVKAFVNGELVDGFVGALDRAGVDAFIDRICPSESEVALARAEAALAAGEHDGLEQIVQPLTEQGALHDRAQLLLAQLRIAAGDGAGALAALDAVVEGSPLAERAHALRLQMELTEAAVGHDAQTLSDRIAADAADSEARWALAGRKLAEGDHEGALEQLLRLVQHDRAFRDDGARRAMLAIFELIGPNHDLSRQFRRQLQIYT